MMNDNNDKKRPLTYYYMLMLVLILVFNSVIMPMFFNPKKCVPYGKPFPR
jgi:predicted nucleic acid-binding Zn ribbon protein